MPRDPPLRRPRMAANSAERELVERLRGVGARLGSPPGGVDELLSLLEEVETWLVRVEQSPSECVSRALRPTMASLVKKELLGHTDTDVKVAAATCLTEVTRITAPDAPYEDDVMKDVFSGMVEAFEKLDDMDSRSYARRVSILETVAKVRSCVVMLDLECDDLILEMFHHFFRTALPQHPQNVRASMETIMKLVIEESEDVHPQLASCLLQNVIKEEKETLPPSFGLAEKVIGQCHAKLKPVFLQLLQDTPLNKYSEVVSSVCQDGPDVGEGNDVNASGKDTADDSKLSERTVSDKLPHESSKLEQDVSFTERDGTFPNSTPTTVMSNGVTPVDNGEALGEPAAPNGKPEQPNDDEQAKSTDELKSGNSEVAEPASTKPNKSSDLDSKKSRKPNSSTKSKATEHSKDDNDKVVPVASGELPADTKDSLKQPSKADDGVADDTSEPVDNATDSVKPKRGRPPAPKSLDKKAVGKRQASSLYSKKGDEVNDSTGRSMKRPSNDVKSSTRNGEGESSKKQQEGNSKRQMEEAPNDEDTNEDLSLKEMVSPKSFTKVLRKTRGQVQDSGGLKRKHEKESEEIPHKKKRKGFDGSLVGARVKVWWPDDSMFYNGVVDSFDPSSKRHTIAYEDGDVEVLLLKDEKWEFISEEQDNDPDVKFETPRGRKGKGRSSWLVKEGNTETPKSGKGLRSSDRGDLPKKKGRPKGVHMPNDDSPMTSSKLKGKTVSKDVIKTPKTSSNVGKEAGKRSKDYISQSTGKTKDGLSKASGNFANDSSSSGKEVKFGSNKGAKKSKHEAGSKTKDSKDETRSSEVKTRRGRKPKGASARESGNGSDTGSISNKGKLKKKEDETSAKGKQGSGKTSTGKKRKRKARS